MISAWNPAPLVVAGAGLALVLFAGAFVRLRRRGRRDHAGWSRAVLFSCAVAVGMLALVSPLDELGESYLLSGHMLQHVLIGDVAPALALVALRGPLVFFVPPRPVLRAVARLRRVLGFLLRPRLALAAWATVFAAWHVPAAYDYALEHETVHDLEHLSFIVAGLLVWTQLVDPARRHELGLEGRLRYACTLFGFASALGAVLVFAPPLYPAYSGAFGISSLLDQELAGLVMIGEQLASLGVCAAFLVSAGRWTAAADAMSIRPSSQKTEETPTPPATRPASAGAAT